MACMGGECPCYGTVSNGSNVFGAPRLGVMLLIAVTALWAGASAAQGPNPRVTEAQCRNCHSDKFAGLAGNRPLPGIRFVSTAMRRTILSSIAVRMRRPD